MAVRWRVTVEPVLFLFMLAVFMLAFALQDLIYTKVCLEDFPRRVCADLYSPDNKEALDAVQTGSSHWFLGSTLTLALPSIVAAQFIGSWSDAYGRKIPMLIPPLGSMFASLIYIVLSVHLHQTPVWPVLLATFISGLCGGFTSCILTCMSYVAQISSVQTRTARVAVLESMIYLGATLGPLLGGWLQEAGGRPATFTAILACHAAIVIYIIVCIRNIPPRHPPRGPWVREGCGWRHLRECAETIVKQRQEHRRSYLLLLLAAATVVMICTSGEIDTSYFFVRDKPLEWPFSKYTRYLALKFGLGSLTLLAVLPLCRRVPDTLLAVAGLLSKALGLVVLGLAWGDAGVFVSAVVALLSTWPMVALRAAMSKLVEPAEQGKLFACVALLENACTLVASGVFNSVYPATRHFCRGFTFMLAALLLLLPLIIVSILHKSLKKFTKYESVEMAEEAREYWEDEEGPRPNLGGNAPEGVAGGDDGVDVEETREGAEGVEGAVEDSGGDGGIVEDQENVGSAVRVH